MNNLNNAVEVLTQEVQELSGVIRHLEKAIEDAPTGKLRVSNSKEKVTYYWRESPDAKSGIYIKKKDMPLICALAQKEYNVKLLRIAKERMEKLQNFLTEYAPEQMEQLYTGLSPARQKLVVPFRLPEDEFVRQWEQHSYQGKEFAEDAPEILTERGERVRSKSEKILADKFYLKGIPYRYECPLYLNGYGTVYPDFTLLNRRTRQEYYLEHFGLMDNAEYCEKAVKKIATYERNGIFPGKQLLMTFETGRMTLDMKTVDKIIMEYLS